jgi:hypothetical protein
VSIVSFGLLSCNRHLRCGEASGPLLAELESETTPMRAPLSLRWTEMYAFLLF